MSRLINLKGKRFGRLLVLNRGENKGTVITWDCVCECGNTKNIRGYDLRSGKTKSCGCLRRELVVEKNYKHGMSEERIYKIWKDIKKRCYNKRSKSYKDYGGRGIRVCEEWLNDFESFHIWAMENGYQKNLTIDRIEVDGNYEPSNCRWVTRKVQNNNQRLRSDNKTGERGVYFDKNSSKYRVQIKKKNYGSFSTLEEAIDAKKEAMKKMMRI